MGRHKKEVPPPDGELIASSGGSVAEPPPTSETTTASDLIPGQPVPGVTLNMVSELKSGATDEKETRRKTYKKRKSKKSDDVSTLDDPALARYVDGMKTFSTLILEMGCRRMPNPIPPSKSEIELWNDTTGKMMLKYLPKLGDWKEEAEFLVVASILFIPRAKKELPSGDTNKTEMPLSIYQQSGNTVEVIPEP